VKSRLKRHAKRDARSAKEKVRHILRNALREENQPQPKLGSRIAARFAKTGLTADLPELHGQSTGAARYGRYPKSPPLP